MLGQPVPRATTRWNLFLPLSTWVPVARLKQIVLFLAVALIIGLGISTVFRAAISQAERTDFTVYRMAGQAVVNGTDMYAGRTIRGWAYVYPPPFAILMTPFAGLSVFWGALVWYLISIGLTVAAVRMSVRMVCEQRGVAANRFQLTVMPVLVLLVWFLSGLSRGQASVIVMAFVVAAFYFHWQNNDYLGAAFLAGAVLLKVFPLVLLGYFVWRRRWKFVGATIGLLAVGALLLPALVFGWQGNLRYLREWEQVVAQPAVAGNTLREQSDLHDQLLDPAKQRNQSLEAVLWRLTGGPGARPVAIVIGLTVAGVIWQVGRHTHPESEMFIACATLIWMLLVPPVSETHYFVLLLWPLTLVTSLLGDPEDPLLQSIARVTLATFVAVGLLTLCSPDLQKIGLLCWTTLGLIGVLLFSAVRQSARRVAALHL